jgi:Tfp pilus assembly protein FimT
MKQERGFTAFEMVTVTGMIGVAVAIATPNIMRANRSFKLNAAAQEIRSVFQTAKSEALRVNSQQTILFDVVNHTILLNGQLHPLPEGVRFQTQTTTDVPDVIKTAAANGASGALAGQEANEKTVVSFPLRTADNKYVATFNSRGLPQVNPGIVNWLYLVNSDGEQVAITLTSAGSTNTWRRKGSDPWQDLAGNHSGGS